MKIKFVLTSILSLTILPSCSTRIIDPLALPNEGSIIEDFNSQKDLIKESSLGLVGKDEIGLRTEFSNTFIKVDTTLASNVTNVSFNLTNFNFEGKITGLTKNTFNDVKGGFQLTFDAEIITNSSTTDSSNTINVNTSLESLPKASYSAYFYLQNSTLYVDLTNLKGLFNYIDKVNNETGNNLPISLSKLPSYKYAINFSLSDEISMPLTTEENLSKFIDLVYKKVDDSNTSIDDTINLIPVPDLTTKFLKHDDKTYSISSSLSKEQLNNELVKQVSEIFNYANLSSSNMKIDVSSSSATPYKTIFIGDSNGPKSLGNLVDMKINLEADLYDNSSSTSLGKLTSNVSIASSSLFVFDSNANMKEFIDDSSDYLNII